MLLRVRIFLSKVPNLVVVVHGPLPIAFAAGAAAGLALGFARVVATLYGFC